MTWFLRVCGKRNHFEEQRDGSTPADLVEKLARVSLTTNPSCSSSQHFKDLIRLRRTTEWPRSPLDSESATAKETPEIEPLPFTLSHECCISVVQKLTLFLLSMDFTCHADLLLFVCKVSPLTAPETL